MRVVDCCRHGSSRRATPDEGFVGTGAAPAGWIAARSRITGRRYYGRHAHILCLVSLPHMHAASNVCSSAANGCADWDHVGSMAQAVSGCSERHVGCECACLAKWLSHMGHGGRRPITHGISECRATDRPHRLAITVVPARHSEGSHVITCARFYPSAPRARGPYCAS